MNSSTLEFIELYTDGSCLKSRVGGWGYLLRQPSLGIEKEANGSLYPTTNNRMELTAVIEGLKALREPCAVGVTTDSMYVCNGIMAGWAMNWARHNWMHGKDQPVKNADLWEELLRLTETHMVKIQWVRGHDGHPENERCDQLATLASRNHVMEQSEELEQLIKAQRIDSNRENARRRRSLA